MPAMTTTAACRQCLASLSAAAGPGDASCATCGIALISEEGQCLACRERPAHFDGNESLFAYRGATRDLIRAYKFDGRLTLSGWFAQALATRLDPCDHDVVVPAPARPAGTRRRGYDHIALIAQQLGRRHRLAVTLALRRRRGAEQKGLDYEQRARNLVGRIWIRPRCATRLVDARVVVIDDVFTTGATIDECARVLKAAGARSVRSLTLARD